MRLQLIGKANGVGLSRDFELLGAALRACGCEVTLRACEKPERKRRRSLLVRAQARARRWIDRGGARAAAGGGRGGAAARRAARHDINVMLEHVWPQFLHEARCNVVVPNPEWFDRRDQRMLGLIDRIWAKTAIAQRLFQERGCATTLIGFDSEDRDEPRHVSAPRFLHLAGRSPLKGSGRLVALWKRHPEWPILTLVQDPSARGALRGEGVRAGNIVYHGDYLPDEALRELQNTHRFHLCPSEAEGWGHYIAEAMSVRAVALTCDAAPMNELIAPGRGLLLAGRGGEAHNLAQLFRFDDTALEAAVARALALSAHELESIGAAARAWFLANKTGFVRRVQRALQESALGYRAAGDARPAPDDAGVGAGRDELGPGPRSRPRP